MTGRRWVPWGVAIGFATMQITTTAVSTHEWNKLQVDSDRKAATIAKLVSDVRATRAQLTAIGVTPIVPAPSSALLRGTALPFFICRCLG